MDLSIIIVNYRSAQHIYNLLKSIEQFPMSILVEWIVVDNDSKDESKQWLCTEFPFIVWVDMGYNAGFSRANNCGMKWAKGNCFLLLNPDTIAIDNSIESCFLKLQNSSYAAVGIQLLHADGLPQISGSFFVRGGLNHLLPIPYWGQLLRQIAFGINSEKPHILQAREEERVDWISGAFLMVKRAAVDLAGNMDEDFFLYAEEVEWCSRFVQAGGCCIYGNLSMVHLIGETITKSFNSLDNSYSNVFDRKGLQLILSNHLRIRKQYGIGWFLFQLLNYTWGIPVFLISGLLNNLWLLRPPFAHVQKWWGYSKNVLMIWYYFPKLMSKRPYFYKVL